MGKYVIAHDLGTSGNKATLFTLEGQMVNSAVYSYDVHYFNGNWAEQDPEEWWKAICGATKALLKDVDPKEVGAISFSGHMMGCLCVDREGNALRPAIIWADMRSGEQEHALESNLPEERFYQIVGHKLSRSYTLEKLMWVRDNEPDVYEKTYKVLNAKDYIVWRLTGEFMTDPSDASGTNAYDLHTRDWSDEVLRAAGIDRDKFPEIQPSALVAGKINAKMCGESGLAEGTLVVLGGGDGCVASLGAGSVKEGVTYASLGSSAWISTATKKPYFDPQMRTATWAHVIPGLVTPSGTMQAAGSSFSWAKNHLYDRELEEARQSGRDIYELINERIAQSPPGANALMFLPYLLGERAPRWNSNARGSFIGLKMEHDLGDLMRSVVEGIALNMNVILGFLKNAVEIREMIVVGGLAKGAIQQQIFADMFGMDIVCLRHLEHSTAIGAAVLAGVGMGALDYADAGMFNEKVSRRSPVTENIGFYDKMKPMFEDAYASQLDLWERLAKL